jgi:hypothetical protein
VIRPKHRHIPQGTTQVLDARDDDRLDAKADRMVEGVKGLPDDNDIHDLIDAMQDRDDAETKRLLPILKARYGDAWPEIGRACLATMGRWHKRPRAKRAAQPR